MAVDFLPENIIEQIVGRISCIKTILRCTSVCKSWYSFIKSTQFVKFHLSMTNANNNNIDKHLLCHLCRFPLHSDYDRFAVHNDSREFEYYITAPVPHIAQFDACDGLICYSRFDDPQSLYLWNPIIRKVKKLPDLNNVSCRLDIQVFRLWFDSKANDYKILMIVNRTLTKDFSVHVYSLATNSWKPITGVGGAPFHSYIPRPTCVGGSFYWAAWKDRSWILVSLDTKGWMFREIKTKLQSCCIYLAPSNHDDSLIVVNYCKKAESGYHKDHSVFDVYKYTTDELYSDSVGKEGRIDLLLPSDVEDLSGFVSKQPLGVGHNDELIIQNCVSSRLFSYNMKTKKRIELDSTSIHDIDDVTPFVQTLVLLDDTDAYRI